MSCSYQILVKLLKNLFIDSFMDFLNLTTICIPINLDHALITITEKIRKAIDNGEITCGVFLDLQKAFDTNDNEILLSKLEHYGIHGVPLIWSKTFLTQRHQHVSSKNSISETLTNNHGVPQDSILGPLLLIYINDVNLQNMQKYIILQMI